jgi:hypothetical protein
LLYKEAERLKLEGKWNKQKEFFNAIYLFANENDTIWRSKFMVPEREEDVTVR